MSLSRHVVSIQVLQFLVKIEKLLLRETARLSSHYMFLKNSKFTGGRFVEFYKKNALVLMLFLYFFEKLRE